MDNGDSRRPRWGHLVDYLGFIYSYVLTLKCSLNLTIYLNPNTAVLGMSNPTTTVTFFLPITVHETDYHWDRHSYFVIHSHHAQTMTHTPPSDDSLLIHLLVVSGL
jgi:hypothetical protein